MRSRWLLPAAACCLQMACSQAEKLVPPPKAVAVESARVTQFYASPPKIARGQRTLLCYGVENAKTVRIDPPRQELSAVLSRCIEVTPAATTTYVLTAEGADGRTATQSLSVEVGAPLAKIVNVTVSSVEVKPGDLVNICYTVENAKSVTIAPLHFAGGSKPKGCVNDTPRKPTTYVISAFGPGGDKDEERVTVNVK